MPSRARCSHHSPSSRPGKHPLGRRCRLRNVMPRVRLVRHSVAPPCLPAHPGRTIASRFWQLFLGRFAISKYSLCLPYVPRPSVRPSVGMKRNWGFGNWRDDGRAVSRICHSLVGPSLRQTGGQPGIPRACCRRRRCTRWWFFSHSRITTRLSNVYSAELGDFLGSSSQCRLRIHCRVCGGVRLLAATN